MTFVEMPEIGQLVVCEQNRQDYSGPDGPGWISSMDKYVGVPLKVTGKGYYGCAECEMADPGPDIRNIRYNFHLSWLTPYQPTTCKCQSLWHGCQCGGFAREMEAAGRRRDAWGFWR